MVRKFLRIVAGVLVFCAATGQPSTSATVVAAGGDFQAALDNASPGDTIALQAGATFTGNFILPKKKGTDYITITSSQADALPGPGTRVQPSDAVNMPKIVTPNGAAALATAPGAHHYRLVGLEISPAQGVYGLDLLDLGDFLATSVANLADHITVDRVYLHGDPVMGSKRGIGLNSISTTIENCYISDFKSSYQDAQAIAGWNGPGPYAIENNYLEGSGENLLFGGAAPAIPNLVPTGITIRRNYFFKPLSWKQDDPSYAGTLWTVKNCIELKNAQNVIVAGNIFENNWAQSQNGFGLVLTVRLQGGLSAVLINVMFRNNIVRHMASAVNILGMDDLSNNQGVTNNLTFSNNLFEDINGAKWGE